ncbi:MULTISPECIES: biotin transporter BioY [Clostridium]|uniref:Biotin transporter n=1 Tax=Clostridium aquiflavi TaxID=3073603 RepID=A0ABU1EKC0_9CLOT|nr:MULTISPECIES: biotin transporter BioY [unclassified Clostridium]MDR5588836.1 biotin transporter BioY [Clostridium sp. 5N-1]
MFAVITAICAQISIPFFQVPFTMQVFAIVLSAVILGYKKAFISQIIYILLGAIGLPVFAGFKGGIQALLGPTGGYITSFLLMVLIIGYFSEKYNDNYFIISFSGTLGIIICYIIGTAQLAFILNITFSGALKIGVLPFVIFDLAKIFLGIFLGINIKKRIYII